MKFYDTKIINGVSTNSIVYFDYSNIYGPLTGRRKITKHHNLIHYFFLTFFVKYSLPRWQKVQGTFL